MPNLVVDSTSNSTDDTGSKGPVYDQDFAALDPDTEDTSESEDESEESEAEEEVSEVNTESEESEEDDEEDDSEDKEDKDEDEEDKRPDIPFDRPSISEIKAEFPNFFKKFPSLKEAFFREVEFTKIFPTVEDAKEAFTDNEAFTVLSDAALSGNPEPIIDSLSKTDEKALGIFAESFLPILYKKNQELYARTVNPLMQNLVRAMVKDKDENTKNAGMVLSQFIFGEDGEDIATGKKSVAVRNVTTEQAKQSEAKEVELNTKFRASAGRVQETITKSLESQILKSKLFDPNKVFSPALRKMGAQEVIKSIMNTLTQDMGHMSVIASRWKRARSNGYTSDDESKIISTYLARAKSLIPNAASKVSASMLGSKKKDSSNRSARLSAVAGRKENNSGRHASSSSSSNGKSRADLRKMSDMDILEMD